MPGMIDAHLHLSWNNAPGIDPIQMMEPEEHMLVTMEMAKLVLDAGFTAGRGAAAAKPRLDVVAKRFINEGRYPGPRYTSAGPEITTVGGLGDAAPSHIPASASCARAVGPVGRARGTSPGLLPPHGRLASLSLAWRARRREGCPARAELSRAKQQGRLTEVLSCWRIHSAL